MVPETGAKSAIGNGSDESDEADADFLGVEANTSKAAVIRLVTDDDGDFVDDDVSLAGSDTDAEDDEDNAAMEI